MRKFYIPVLTLCFMAWASFSANAQKNFFTVVGESSIPANEGKRVIFPTRLTAVKLDNDGMRSFLWSLPSENEVMNSRRNAPVLALPMPDGSFARFNVWQSSVQEPGGEARFPEIKTFAGQGIDDPAATVRFDYNPYFGFSAQILSPNGRVYVDPYARGNVNYFMSYYHNDNPRVTRLNCKTEDDMRRAAVSNSNTSSAAGTCRGTQLFTYRLAVAVTHQYSAAVGGGIAGPVHAAIVTTVNRITGVYENELAVRLVLVANNHLVEYLTSGSHPYNNTVSGAQLNTNNTNLNSVIGTANYDIGHLFTTDDSGLAQLGVVCSSGKGRGATGRPNPTGDGFDIDYVAHEIGHQFGANHTYNSGDCFGPPELPSAYEPGGGSTIMAYAGICSPTDNIQPRSDGVFHTKSYDEITSYMLSGGTCRVATATGNTLPVITSMSGNNVTIPARVPFTLTATATDADGDAITYNWEGWDRGTVASGQSWFAPASLTSGPLFRSRVPRASGSRTFPDERIILANYPVNPPSAMNGLKGERLPTVTRQMKFRLTVRDNRAGGGAIVTGGDGCQADLTGFFIVNAHSTTGTFAVTVPNGGESYPGGSTQTITWIVAQTNEAPISTANVKITMSTDGGLTYPHLVTASTPNDGSEALALPVVGPTTTARIKIEAVDNIYFDISNNNFSITGSAAPNFEFTSPAATTVVCAGPTSASTSLGTTVTGGFNTPIALTSSGAPVGTTVSFSSNPLTPGNSTNVTLNNTNTLANGTYTITVTGTAGATVKTREISFVVSGGTGPAITTQPTAQSGCAGSAANFSVVATGANSYQWQVSTNGGTSFTDIAGANNATLNIASITGAQTGNIYRVVTSNQCNSTTSSNAVLTVSTAPAFTTQPVNTDACNGGNATITSVVSGTATYQWQISTNGGVSYSNIPGATSASLPLNAVTTSMTGNRYKVIATNSCGSTTSNAATLTVNSVAAITTQPVSVSNLCSGLNTSFTVAATGTGIAYQWQVSTNGGSGWTDISGATSATYSINNVAPGLNNNQYRAQVTSACSGTPLISNAATLTVLSSVNVVTAPTAKAVCDGFDTQFSVNATGNGLTYQWQMSTNGGSSFTDIAGATGSQLSIDDADLTMDGNLYRVVLSAIPCGTVTPPAVELSVNPIPVVVLSTPAITALYPGLTTTITASVTPPPSNPNSFQWFLDGVIIPGATSSSYTVSADKLGEYSATATDGNGCFGSSSTTVLIRDSAARGVFVYPNPNNGVFTVIYNSTSANTTGSRSLTVYDAKGSRVFTKKYPVTATSDPMTVDLRKHGRGIYTVELREPNGTRVEVKRIYVY